MKPTKPPEQQDRSKEMKESKHGKILATRLRASREATSPKISQREIARRLDFAPATVSLWESGTTQPNIDTLVQLAGIYNVGVEWLMGIKSAVAIQQSASTQLVYTVPILPRSALIKWQFEKATGAVQSSIAFPADYAAAVPVDGGAMLVTTGNDCMAIVTREAQLDQNALVMIVQNGSVEPTMRRVDRDSGNFWFVADNPQYPAISESDARVVGQVVELVRRKVFPQLALIK